MLYKTSSTHILYAFIFCWVKGKSHLWEKEKSGKPFETPLFRSRIQYKLVHLAWKLVETKIIYGISKA